MPKTLEINLLFIAVILILIVVALIIAIVAIHSGPIVSGTIAEKGSPNEVKIKILGTNDSYTRYLGVAINSKLDDLWWETGGYTCNYVINPYDVGEEFLCNFTGDFEFAKVSVSSSTTYAWNISITYPDGRNFYCKNINRELRCPP